MYSQSHGLTHVCTLHLNFACMVRNHTRAIGRTRSAWAPCIPFQDNLESNSGLNFNVDCTHNFETHNHSVIDYVALDRFSDFRHAKRALLSFAGLDGPCESVRFTAVSDCVCVCTVH